MTEVTGAITSLIGVVGGVWDLITSNPLGLLSIGAAGLTMYFP